MCLSDVQWRRHPSPAKHGEGEAVVCRTDLLAKMVRTVTMAWMEQKEMQELMTKTMAGTKQMVSTELMTKMTVKTKQTEIARQ